MGTVEITIVGTSPIVLPAFRCSRDQSRIDPASVKIFSPSMFEALREITTSTPLRAPLGTLDQHVLDTKYDPCAVPGQLVSPILHLKKSLSKFLQQLGRVVFGAAPLDGCLDLVVPTEQSDLPSGC
jgi:hypothetical protein